MKMLRVALAALAGLTMLSFIALAWTALAVAWHDVGAQIAADRRADEWHRIVVLQCQPKPARWSPAAIRASHRGW